MVKEQEVRQRRRRRTPAEIEQIVSEFKSGDLTQVEFCRRQGLVLSTIPLRTLGLWPARSITALPGVCTLDYAISRDAQTEQFATFNYLSINRGFSKAGEPKGGMGLNGR